jgi:hypothetical protein
LTDDQRTYHAYLLRLWRVNTGPATVWHASLEDPRTGERTGFADLQGLCAFLEEQYSGSVSQLPGQIGDDTWERWTISYDRWPHLSMQEPTNVKASPYGMERTINMVSAILYVDIASEATSVLEDLEHLSLGNCKQLLHRFSTGEVILQVACNDPESLSKAVTKFAGIEGVLRVTTFIVKRS